MILCHTPFMSKEKKNDTIIVCCSGFQRDLAKSKFEIYVKIPRISLDGFFKSRGNILFLPIFGSGAVNLTLGKNSHKFKLYF